VQVSMSSLDVMLSVSSRLDTYIAEVQDGGTLSVNAFEFWHARCPSAVALHGLRRTCSVRLHCRPMWNASFLYVSCSILDDEALCSGLSRCEFVKKTQSGSAERNLLSTVTVFQRLDAANVTDLYRNSLTEQNWYGDWQLFDGEQKTILFHELNKIKIKMIASEVELHKN